jgi:hypothetical protein
VTILTAAFGFVPAGAGSQSAARLVQQQRHLLDAEVERQRSDLREMPGLKDRRRRAA